MRKSSTSSPPPANAQFPSPPFLSLPPSPPFKTKAGALFSFQSYREGKLVGRNKLKFALLAAAGWLFLPFCLDTTGPKGVDHSSDLGMICQHRCLILHSGVVAAKMAGLTLQETGRRPRGAAAHRRHRPCALQSNLPAAAVHKRNVQSSGRQNRKMHRHIQMTNAVVTDMLLVQSTKAEMFDKEC